MSNNYSTENSKRKRFAVRCTVALLMFVAGMLLAETLNAQNANEKPGIFYAITGNGLKDTSWLFGTYHLINSSYLNEMPVVKKSFIKIKGLVVEIVIDSTKLPQAQAMGLLKDKTLSSLLDKPFSDSLEQELMNTIGAGIAQLNQLKPMNVTLTLSIVHLMKNNNEKLKQYSGLPLDAQFVQDGKQTSKAIVALETVEEQMDLLFNKIPDEEQVNQLKSFIRNKTEMIALGDELMQSWFDADLDNMYAIYEKTIKLSGEMDYLVKKRNDAWMKILPGLLQKQSQFIAVGALHLAGPDGLVKQLQQLGYTVTPIK